MERTKQSVIGQRASLRSYREVSDLIYKVIDSPSPLLLVGFLAENLDD
jgi:hypothetical protein